MIKSKRMRWARHLARKGDGEMGTKFGLANLKGSDPSKYTGVYRK
jgi:hypothetical protein